MPQISILANEISNDPLGRGYSGMTDGEVAVDLNTVYRERNRTSMTASEVLQAVNVTEFVDLTDVQESRIMGLLAMGTLNPFGVEADIFLDCFGGASDTITALQALRKEDISRGEEIGWGWVKVGHVEMARG